MRIHGKKIETANEVILVIPRPDGDIVFKARAITDSEPFELMCPKPVMPTVLSRTQGYIANPENATYKALVADYAQKKTDWTILTSLSATPGLEWDTVDLANPATWHNYREELKNCKFSEIEQIRIINLVWEANALDEAKLDEARKRFLASAETPIEQLLSQTEEQVNTLSGELANGSVSVLPG